MTSEISDFEFEFGVMEMRVILHKAVKSLHRMYLVYTSTTNLGANLLDLPCLYES